MMNKLCIDLTGQTFGRWRVVRKAPVMSHGAMWICECQCGSVKSVTAASLRRGESTSCGCSVVNAVGARHPLYNTWQAVMRRCYRPSARGFDRYGGRGITVCERWYSLPNFIADMGPKPTPEHTVDRIDSKGNYEPSNCRWASPIEQGRNKQNNRILEINGVRRCIAEWSEISGIGPNTVKCRLDRGWSDERAVFEPSRRNHKFADAVTGGK